MALAPRFWAGVALAVGIVLFALGFTYINHLALGFGGGSYMSQADYSAAERAINLSGLGIGALALLPLFGAHICRQRREAA